MNISILQSRQSFTRQNPQPRMTKTFHTRTDIPNPTGYDKGMWFDHHTLPVDGIHTLSELLTGIEPDPSYLVIRGELLPDVDATLPVLRRIHPDDHHRPYYRESPNGTHLVMVDFDKAVPLPDHLVREWSDSLAVEIIEYVIQTYLPVEFHDVTCHYQWSSSARTNGISSIAKCHLWFWLEVARTDTEMRRWAEPMEIDETVFNPVQVHYTAAPIFRGVVNPFSNGGRSGLLLKRRDTVPSFVIPPVPIYVPPPSKASVIRRTAGIASIQEMREALEQQSQTNMTLTDRLNRIDVRLHKPINQAIAAAVKMGVDWYEFKPRIIERIMLSSHGDKHIYLRDAYLDASYRGAVRKFGGASSNPMSMANGYAWRRDRRLARN